MELKQTNNTTIIPINSRAPVDIVRSAFNGFTLNEQRLLLMASELLRSSEIKPNSSPTLKVSAADFANRFEIGYEEALAALMELAGIDKNGFLPKRKNFSISKRSIDWTYLDSKGRPVVGMTLVPSITFHKGEMEFSLWQDIVPFVMQLDEFDLNSIRTLSTTKSQIEVEVIDVSECKAEILKTAKKDTELGTIVELVSAAFATV